MNDQAEGRHHGGCLIPSASRGWACSKARYGESDNQADHAHGWSAFLT